MIGVVVPALNEKNSIKACLASILEASSDFFFAHAPDRVVVVLNRHLRTAYSDSDRLHHIQRNHQEGRWVLPTGS